MRPSARLLRAVAAERAQLERQRARLAHEADDLRAALARIENGMAEIDERCRLLDRLAPTNADGGPGEAQAVGPAVARGPGLLRGPAIREAAVRALVARGGGGEALHYRAWFELLTKNGYEVAGKDPLAVFLTQLGRSPVVRKGAAAGVYELDRRAPARLRARLDGLHRELGELTADGTADLAAIRARRARVTTEIGRAERALDEAGRVLASPPALAAAG